jgi:hypothetical protein
MGNRNKSYLWLQVAVRDSLCVQASHGMAQLVHNFTTNIFRCMVCTVSTARDGWYITHVCLYDLDQEATACVLRILVAYIALNRHQAYTRERDL